jgi:hypothetical protein
MGFVPRISDRLKTMDDWIFRDECPAVSALP